MTPYLIRSEKVASNLIINVIRICMLLIFSLHTLHHIRRIVSRYHFSMLWYDKLEYDFLFMFAFTKEEKEEDCVDNIFRGVTKPEVVVTDRDLALVNALRKTFTDLLCI